MSGRLQTAQHLVRHHKFSIIPTNGKKGAVKWAEFQKRKPTAAELKKWFSNSGHDIAVVTGEVSGVIVIDADDKAAVNYLNRIAPNTPTVRTPGGGIHKYFAYTKGIKNKVRLNGRKLDVRSDGGYAIIHSEGRHFVKGKSFDDVSPAPIPKELLKLIKQDNGRKDFQVQDCYDGVNDGARNVSLTRVVGSLCRDGLTFNEVLTLAGEVNKTYKPPMEDSRVKTIVDSIFNREQGKRTPKEVQGRDPKGFRLDTISAYDLDRQELPELIFTIDKVVQAGTANGVVAKPKKGKSIFCMNLAVAVATGDKALGGQLEVKEGSVLYLCLEDRKARTQERLRQILQGSRMPRNLDLVFHTKKRVNDGLLDGIENWMDEHPDSKLIIVDTLIKVRPETSNRKTLYEQDYKAVEGLKKIANEKNVAILIVIHARKSDSDDPQDLISGTTGLAGGLDNILVLTREKRSPDCLLYITGRDIEEAEHTLSLNPETLTWEYQGGAEENRITPERREIIDLLKVNKKPMTPKVIAKKLEKKESAVKHLLSKLVSDNQIKNLGRGRYISISPDSTNFGNCTDSPDCTDFQKNNGRESGGSGCRTDSKSSRKSLNNKTNSRESVQSVGSVHYDKCGKTDCENCKTTCLY